MTASGPGTAPGSHRRRAAGLALSAAVAAVGIGGIGGPAFSSGTRGLPAGRSSAASGTVVAVGAENEYANVIGQIGGHYVKVSSVLDNPNTDPHTFESSPSVAEAVGAAQLVVQNGLGYDTFMDRIESASPEGRRRVITVQTLLRLADSTPNPHLWYSPGTMPAVAKAVASDLSRLVPGRAAYFTANMKAFDHSLGPWLQAMRTFKTRYRDVPVATTEPVADYMLAAMGTDNLTPFGMQADIMNGVDPSPQDITLEDNLLTQRKVKVFVYNEQVVDSLTTSFRATAQRAGIPVVGVYETMPTPGYDYQTWMLAEVDAIQKAVAAKVSTERL